MANALLQLNDLNLVWQSEDGLQANAIGVAHVSDQGIICGDEAWRRLWLEPQYCYTQYWQQFNQNSLIPTKPGVRHNADLVFHQLQQLKKTRLSLRSENVLTEQAQPENPSPDNESLLISPPSHFRQSELELLLAVGQSLELPVCSFIDSAVAAVASSNVVDLPAVNRVLFIDMQLHQTQIIEVLCKQGRWVQGKVTPLGDCGLLQVLNTSAHYLANLFVSEHRFDPLKLGATSQSLYELVFSQLLFSDSDFPLEMESKDGRLNCTIATVEWRQMLSLRLKSLLENINEQIDDNSAVCLHENSHWLSQHFNKSISLVNVADKDIGKFLFQHWPLMKVNELVYVDSLERQTVDNEAYSLNKNTVSESKSTAFPSHLLYDNVAYPLEVGLWIRIDENRLDIHCQPIKNPILVLAIEQQSLTLIWDQHYKQKNVDSVNSMELSLADKVVQNGEVLVIHGQLLTFISVKMPVINERPTQSLSSEGVI